VFYVGKKINCTSEVVLGILKFGHFLFFRDDYKLLILLFNINGYLHKYF